MKVIVCLVILFLSSCSGRDSPWPYGYVPFISNCDGLTPINKYIKNNTKSKKCISQ